MRTGCRQRGCFPLRKSIEADAQSDRLSVIDIEAPDPILEQTVGILNSRLFPGY